MMTMMSWIVILMCMVVLIYYDDYDELDCYSDVHGSVDPANYYAPTDMECMHELHGPDRCGVYCQLRHEIRPYGHSTPQFISVECSYDHFCKQYRGFMKISAPNNRHMGYHRKRFQ